MTTLAGQAARGGAAGGGRALRGVLQSALVLACVAAAALGLLAWRLGQGPLRVDFAAHLLARASGLAATVDGASLAWDGFAHGVGRPVRLHLTGLRLVDPAAGLAAEVDRADVSLAPGPLLAGQVVPRTVAIDGARLAVRLRQGTGGPPPDLPALIGPGNAALRQLRTVHAQAVSVSIDEPGLGTPVRLDPVAAEFARTPTGGIAGTGRVVLAVADQSATLALSASFDPASGISTVAADVSPVVPALLSFTVPPLAALRVLDAPVALHATARLRPDLSVDRIDAQARVGAGMAYVADGSLPIVDALASVTTDLASAEVTVQQFRTAPRPGGPVSTARASATLRRVPEGVAAALSLDLDHADFADLPLIWPAGTGGPGTRPWITGNITAGTGHDLHVEIEGTAPLDLSDAQVSRIAGGMAGDDLTVHWLRPVPPAEHVSGRLTLVTADRIDIALTAGRQSGLSRTGIDLRRGTVVLTGIAGHDQFADISTDLAGPVADVITLLRHPKLRLLDRRPLTLRDPAGTFAGTVSVGHLPLKDDVSLDDLAIRTQARARGVHLGGIAVGRDLDRGELAITAGNDGLDVSGTAQVAGLPTRLHVAMDFRDGPPTEVLTRVEMTSHAPVSAVAQLGFDPAPFMSGSVDLRAGVVQQRDGRGDVTLHADLAQAAVEMSAMALAKPKGAPATADVHLVLDHDRLVAVQRIAVEGDGLDVHGAASMADGRPDVLRLDRVRLGGTTDVSGTVTMPARPGAPYVVSLAGPSLDLSAVLARRADPAAPAPHATGPAPPWRADLRLERLIGAGGVVVSGLHAAAENDGQATRTADVAGDAGGPFALRLWPDGDGRALRATAADAGRLLRGAGVASVVHGGRLDVSGRFDDSQPGRPLSGTATLDGFRVTGVPILAKILQAATLYGLVEALQGPGLGVIRAVVPFRYAGGTLALGAAHAFSASLGATARGTVDVAADRLDLTGTIVPAYALNTLPGRLPLVGRLFSPERGGGLLAADFGAHGALADPAVHVNPLSLLAPGILRELLGGLGPKANRSD